MSVRGGREEGIEREAMRACVSKLTEQAHLDSIVGVVHAHGGPRARRRSRGTHLRHPGWRL
eukprot:6205256-Pleurochrysis_carterae.AAC.1